MKAIILAAGRGSRMNALTTEKPKCLLEFRGKTLLQSQIDAIRACGIDNIAIVTGYLRQKLEPYTREFYEFNNPDWATTNMVSTLTCASDWLQQHDCIVSYSDIFYDHQIVSGLIDSAGDIAIAYDPNWINQWSKRFKDPLTDAETFRVDAEGVLLEIGKKPDTIAEVEGQYMGLLRFTPRGWVEFSKVVSLLNYNESQKIDMTSMLQKVIESGQVRIHTSVASGQWWEFDSESDLINGLE